jgi:hypothetical protein
MTERADHHNDHHHDENVYYDAALNTFAAIGVYHTINSGLKLIKSYAPTNVFMVAEAVINGIETIKNMPPSYMVAAATTIAAVAVTINHACEHVLKITINKRWFLLKLLLVFVKGSVKEF